MTRALRITTVVSIVLYLIGIETVFAQQDPLYDQVCWSSSGSNCNRTTGVHACLFKEANDPCTDCTNGTETLSQMCVPSTGQECNYPVLKVCGEWTQDATCQWDSGAEEYVCMGGSAGDDDCEVYDCTVPQ